MFLEDYIFIGTLLATALILYIRKFQYNQFLRSLHENSVLINWYLRTIQLNYAIQRIL
jgi:hypothetical protein